MALRALVDVPLAADELIRIDRRFDDVALAADGGAESRSPAGPTDAAGGAKGGLPVVISSAGHSIGLAAAVAAACCSPEPPLACGLGTGALSLATPRTRCCRWSASWDGWIYPTPDSVETGEDLTTGSAGSAAAEVLARS